MLNGQVARLIGAEIDARIGAAVGVAPQLVRGAARDLGWVAGSRSAEGRSRRSSTVSAAN